MKNLMILSCLFFTGNVFAISFNDAIKSLATHESVESMIGNSKATFERGDKEGSWGDPEFKVAAKNLPQSSQALDELPVSGIEYSISQKIALTTKYGNIEDSFKALSKAYGFDAQDKKEQLAKVFWEVLIIKRRVVKELTILNENKSWFTKILRVTKKLYANGKSSQQALLDIQIRKSEIESKISNKNFELAQIDDKLDFLIGTSKIDSKSIPWKQLNKVTKDVGVIDNKELSLKEKLKSKELKLTASKMNYVPDLTVSLGYTKRSFDDELGDYVGASISFPLPFSSEKYSVHGQAVHERFAVAKNYELYKRSKKRDVSIIRREISKLETELSILKKKTISFAQNSRSITSKSYGLGRSSYVEVLQSELKLQKILIHQLTLESKRDIKKVTLKYILGESTNE